MCYNQIFLFNLKLYKQIFFDNFTFVERILWFRIILCNNTGSSWRTPSPSWDFNRFLITNLIFLIIYFWIFILKTILVLFGYRLKLKLASFITTFLKLFQSRKTILWWRLFLELPLWFLWTVLRFWTPWILLILAFTFLWILFALYRIGRLILFVMLALINLILR